MNHDKVLANKVEHVSDPTVASADCCDDPVLFAMKDNEHSFSMGLFTILKCLKIAEKEGYVPSLPEEWWYNIRVSYHFSPGPDK